MFNYSWYCLVILLLASCVPTDMQTESRPEYVLVVHGGAGTIKREHMSPEREAAYRTALQLALDTGGKILAAGGSASDAVEATIHTMEDDSLFNSGKGAVFTHEGTVELDASFMDGKTLNAGSVAGVQTVKHPISAARMVMDSSVHVMMAGQGADEFANSMGLEIVENSYFQTERRRKQLEIIQQEELGQITSETDPEELLKRKYGTVGCVALDKAGNLAAGTSTGGMTNKRFGRVGDSPIIGAGTYANNATCAISCTGHGEYFIRNVIAYDVSAQMEYGKLSLTAAADSVIMDKLTALGGTGGLIAVDGQGNIAMPFNTSGMYRGYVTSNGETAIKIYAGE